MIPIMLIGTYRREIDDMARLVLPERWRTGFTRGLILTRGVDKNLMAFPIRRFQAIAEGIATLTIENTDARNWSRFLIGSATHQPLDKLGRLEIPPPLRVFASVVKDVVLVGVLNRIEIWDATKYEECEARSASDIVQIAERVGILLRATAARTVG